MSISAVINTYNEEKNIERCLLSVKDFADEIIVVDMHSSDKTVEIAKKYKAKVFQHEYTRYVEPARNFALSKATGDWIFLIDADEELSNTLKIELERIVKENNSDFVKIPRKNIIFNKWIEHSRWWPDYLVRFFKNGKVKFSNEIHTPPQTEGKELVLGNEGQYAIVHHNFQSISQYIERLNRYSDIQSSELIKNKYLFNWKDLLIKPSNEFFSRFFSGEGYKDGLHGFALAVLQSLSEFTVYLKVWESGGFEERNMDEFPKTAQKVINDYLYWQQKITTNSFKKLIFKIKAKL